MSPTRNRLHLGPSRRSVALAGLGGLLVLAVVPLSDALAAASGPWAMLLEVNAQQWRPSVWVPIVDAGRIAKPILILIAVFLGYLCLRRSFRAVSLLIGVFLACNLSVQFIKLPRVSGALGLDDLDPLSGHVGLAASVCLGWLLVAPASCRIVSALSASFCIAVVSAGVVLVGWHTVPQVLCCLGLCLGWCLVGASFSPRSRNLDSESVLPFRVGVGGLLVGTLVLGWALSSSRGLGGNSSISTASQLAVTGALGGSALVVGAVVIAMSSTVTRVRTQAPPPGRAVGDTAAERSAS